MVYLVETKIKAENVMHVKESTYFQTRVFFFLITIKNHVLGRIWLCWCNETYNVNPILKADYLIHCEVELMGSSMKWLGSFVYGSNSGIKRSLL
jgi:hypothetical protein